MQTQAKVESTHGDRTSVVVQGSKRKSPHAPPPTSRQQSPPSEVMTRPIKTASTTHRSGGAVQSAPRTHTAALATTKRIKHKQHQSTPPAPPNANAAAAGVSPRIPIPSCIPTTTSGKIIGIRTAQPLPAPPPQFTSPLSSPLCDASVIVTHKPSEVRQAIDHLRTYSLHLPVGKYVICVFVCSCVCVCARARARVFVFV